MRRLLQAVGVALLVAGTAVGPASGRPPSATPLEPWSFREDFRNGIPGWMSYPLVQDVGYDPTLYTRTLGGVPCLVRNVPALGQHFLRVGILKPLSFYAGPSSSFRLEYSLAMGGPIERVRFMLAADDGRLYPLDLPDSPGPQAVHELGKSLGLPTEGAEIQAVLLVADVPSPLKGTSNRLILRQFEIKAQRPAEVALAIPPLVRTSNEGQWLDTQALTPGDPLVIEAKTEAPVKIQAFDSEGDEVPTESEPAGNAYPSSARQVVFRRGAPGLWRVVVSNGRAQTEFRALVLSPIPPHPRTFFSAERLRELRKLAGSTPLLEAIRARAKSLRAQLAYNPRAGDDIALLPATSVFPGLSGYFKLLEDYSNAIAFNAVEYALSGDRQALEAARRALLTVSEWPTWTPPWFLAQGLHTYYEVGVFSQRVAIGYDLIADQLTPAEKSAITQAAFRNAIEPTVEEYFLRNRMPIAASNWMANSVGGALAWVAALYGDVPEWNGRLGTALAELCAAYDHLLTGLFPGDGSEAEPAGYEAFAMEGLSTGIAALHAFGIRPPETARMIQGFWWPRYAEVTPNLVLDTGDFDGQLRGLSGFAWEAEHSGDPSLRAFYDTAEVGTLVGVSNVSHTGRLLEMAPGILDLACCSEPAATAPEPPPSRIFPGRGSAVLRSGWKPTDTVISIRAGPWFNHEHHDQGTFQVAAFGEKLIGEAGYADYYRDPNYPTYFMQAPGHNTVLVDDDPFSQPGEDGRYWKALAHYPRFTAHVLSPAVDYLSAELADAYGGVLSQFRREFVFLKPDALIVSDELRAPNAHTYQWLLHVPTGDTTRIQGAEATIIGRNAVAALTAAGANAQWRLEATPLAGDRYGDFDRQALRQAHEFRLQSSAGTSCRFLVGMTFGKNRAGTVPATVLSGNHAEGFRLGSSEGAWTLMFRTGAGTLEAGEFSTDGTILGRRQVGLQESVFAAEARSVSRDGKTLLEASRPVSLEFQGSPKGIKLHVDCAAVTSLRVPMAKTSSTVMVDGRRIQPEVANGFLLLRDLSQGEHLVRVVP
jgi:hypothetical protein